ncbi:MAG: hypothetical protein HC895_01385 [Leptolyngbyaceae cyanobacterium SM1_3_5]|nr:hypothetical protein [Leptolyngbyaceae cyanobacterium SM1_3_5]
MSFTAQEAPQINSNRFDSLITGIAIGIVAGIGVGVIASSKGVITSIAAAAAGVGTGSAIAYFRTDYRATTRRNDLHAQHQSAVEQFQASIAQLQAELKEVEGNYDKLASAAAGEISRLQSELSAARRSIVPIECPEAEPDPPVDAPQLELSEATP